MWVKMGLQVGVPTLSSHYDYQAHSRSSRAGADSQDLAPGTSSWPRRHPSARKGRPYPRAVLMKEFFDTSVLVAAFWGGHRDHPASIKLLGSANKKQSACSLL